MTDKVPFGQALKRLIQEKENSITSHPSVGELVAYHDGKLPEERSESLRDHVAICSICTKTLLEFGAGSEPLAMASSASRRELWDDVRRRIRDEDGTETAEESEDEADDPISSRRDSVAAGIDDSIPIPSLFRRIFDRRTVILLVSCVVLVVWGVRLQFRVGELSRPQVIEAMVDLSSDQDSGVRGTETAAKVVSAGGRNLILLNLFDEHGHTRYRVEILDGSGAVKEPLWISTEVRSLTNGAVALDMPPHFLNPGPYRIRLYGLSGNLETFIGHYSLQVD